MPLNKNPCGKNLAAHKSSLPPYFISDNVLTRGKDFITHLKGEKYNSDKEMRNKIFNNIGDVIANPDEVWITYYNSKSAQYRYIKFYNGKTMVVPVDVNTGFDETDKDNLLQIKSWFILKKSEEKNKRGGVLIFKKKNG